MMRQINNFFSLTLFEKLRRFSRETKTMRTNLTQWSSDVIGRSSPILVFDILGDLHNEVKHEIMSAHGYAEYDDYEWAMSIHLGSYLSYIPFHNDSNHHLNITVYLNDKWERDWAGFFIYEDGQSLRAILPKPNFGLIYFTPLDHCVALANINAPVRESLQIFINKR